MVMISVDLFLHSSPYAFMLLGPNMLLGHGPSRFFVDGSIMSPVLGSEVFNDSLSFLHILKYIGTDNEMKLTQKAN